jgi:hypothetical protein
VHKCSVGILEEFFNDCFGRFSVWKARINQVVLSVVSPERPPIAEFGWILRLLVTRTRSGMHENRAALRIRSTGWNSFVRKKNYPLAQLRPLETMPTRSAVWGIDNDNSVVGLALGGGLPCRIRDRSFERYHLKIEFRHVSGKRI